MIGDRAGLDDGVERRLQEAGTYHVIAISGGNIAILAGLMLVGFRVAGLLGRVAMLTAIAGLTAYCFVIGGSASVNRATLMAIVYFGARALDLRGPPINALALVAGLLVAAQPLAVTDAGFLLTFGATTAIILAAPLVRGHALPRLVAPFAAMLAASVAAEAALLPVAAFIFSRITVAGLLLNFAAIPLMAVVQIAGMAVVPVAGIWPRLASAIGWIAHAAAEGLVRSADLVDVAPMLTWRVAPPSPLTIVVYYASLITAWTLWRLAVQVPGCREPNAATGPVDRGRHSRRVAVVDWRGAVDRAGVGRRRPSARHIHRRWPGGRRARAVSRRFDAARRRGRPARNIIVRYRRSRRRASDPPRRDPPARFDGADPRRRRPHRRCGSGAR